MRSLNMSDAALQAVSHKVLPAAEMWLLLLLVSYTASLSGSIGGFDSIIYTKSNLPKKQQNNNHTASSSSPSSKIAAGATRATRENGVAGRPR